MCRSCSSGRVCFFFHKKKSQFHEKKVHQYQNLNPPFCLKIIQGLTFVLKISIFVNCDGKQFLKVRSKNAFGAKFKVIKQ